MEPVMKIRGIVVALLFTATPALAQTAGTSPTFDGVGSTSGSASAARDEGSMGLDETDDPENRHAWYVAPTFGATYINGGFTPMYGVRGAFRLNKKWGFGLAANGFDFDGEVEGQDLEGGYGGLLMEYALVQGDKVQLISGSTIGGGAFCESDPGEYNCKGSHGFFASEPTLNLEVRATSYLRVSAGAGYRFVIAHENRGITGNELGGFVSRLALEFGQF
jgi:hypothetical protein